MQMDMHPCFKKTKTKTEKNRKTEKRMCAKRWPKQDRNPREMRSQAGAWLPRAGFGARHGKKRGSDEVRSDEVRGDASRGDEATRGGKVKMRRQRDRFAVASCDM